MALVFRQTITTNVSEIYALNEAIGRLLFRPLRCDDKISPAEFLSLEPLKKLSTRLNTKWMQETTREKKRMQFSFTFSPQEVLAIWLCIRNYKSDPFLDVVLGKVQQRSLNLDSLVELNHKSLKQ